MKQYYIYILCDRPYGYLYVGVTSDLVRRLWEHRNISGKSYTRKRNINRLVFYEIHTDIETAILREKTLKRWPRQWKFNLIEQDNPRWDKLGQHLN